MTWLRSSLCGPFYTLSTCRHLKRTRQLQAEGVSHLYRSQRFSRKLDEPTFRGGAFLTQALGHWPSHFSLLNFGMNYLSLIYSLPPLHSDLLEKIHPNPHPALSLAAGMQLECERWRKVGWTFKNMLNCLVRSPFRQASSLPDKGKHLPKPWLWKSFPLAASPAIFSASFLPCELSFINPLASPVPLHALTGSTSTSVTQDFIWLPEPRVLGLLAPCGYHTMGYGREEWLASHLAFTSYLLCALAKPLVKHQ